MKISQVEPESKSIKRHGEVSWKQEDSARCLWTREVTADQRQSDNYKGLGHDMGVGKRTREHTVPKNFGSPPKELLACSNVDFCRGKTEQWPLRGWKTYRTTTGGANPLFGRGVLREVFLHPPFSTPSWHSLKGRGEEREGEGREGGEREKGERGSEGGRGREREGGGGREWSAG